jgi:uncharacterized protein (DUF58 family)
MSRWTFLLPLTRRGHTLLWSGIGITAVSLLFGQRDFVRVGIFLVVLPLACLIILSRTRFRLAVSRSLSKNRIPVGTTTTTSLRLHNLSRISSGLLLVEDALPWELGRPQRLVVDRLGGDQWRTISTTVHGTARGRYTVGPASLTLVDPFGLCQTTRRFTTTDVLTVVPVTVPLPSAPPHGDWSGIGESRTRTISSHGQDDVIPREYRIGDDLRRVHWKSTARSGELMVRREERPWRNRVTVLVDNRSGVHRGEGISSSFEWAVTAAASIGVHLLQSGFGVRLVGANGAPLMANSSSVETFSGSDSVAALLDACATVKDDVDPTELTGAHPAAFSDGVVVAILGDLTTQDAELITSLRLPRGLGVALLLDTSSWSGRSQLPADPHVTSTSALFKFNGWRTAICERETSLIEVWQSTTLNSSVGV